MTLTAGGLGFLAVYLLITMLANSDFSQFGTWILEGYYIFFTLFMVGVVLRLEVIIKYCGFVDSVFLKSMFYAL